MRKIFPISELRAELRQVSFGQSTNLRYPLEILVTDYGNVILLTDTDGLAHLEVLKYASHTQQVLESERVEIVRMSE